MIPVMNQFPEFIADQLLTAEDLNSMFGFLEEQERLTRTSMIGIGIICGLTVKTAVDGTSLVISKGAGDTSEGYLIKLETDTYFEYKDFDPVLPKYYDLFVNTTVEADGKLKHTPKIKLWELFAKSETDAKKLDKTFLTDKVVLLFYEMQEKKAKNCDPVSCDDKGLDIEITIRKLLITKEDAEKLLPKEKNILLGGLPVTAGVPVLTDFSSRGFGSFTGFGGLGFVSSAAEDVLLRRLALPDIIMKRFDVAATNLTTSNDVFERYQDIFTKQFVESTGNALTQLYSVFRSLLQEVSPNNPFGNFSNKFSFLFNNTISGNRLLHFQYYYDLFSDLLQAYNEMRWLGAKIIAQCCPDSSLFPRHLLLGEAIPLADQQRSRYRHYFIPSPILNGQDEMVAELKLLFNRLKLMVEKFETPVPVVANKDNIDANIRITPSKLGDVKLSEKALPYYYRPNDADGRLFLHWSFDKARRERAAQLLGYNAAAYNTTDDFVLNPLKYEIEPYNFFRIEGHVGKSYKNALSTVLNIRNRFRLPFDVVALRASLNNGEIDFSKMQCHFQDIDTVYNSLKAEMVCLLCREMIYYYAIPPGTDNLDDTKDFAPQVPLLKTCSPGFRFAVRTFGHEFEQIYPSIKNQDDINLNFFQPGLFTLAAAIAQPSPYVFRRALLFFMEKLFEQLPEYPSQVNIEKLDFYYGRLRSVAEKLRKLLKDQLTAATDHGREVELEDEIDHLDILLFACTQKPFDELITKYKDRLTQVNKLRQLSKFVQKHPGIEHKAGVPKGGTFIIVYHETQKEVPVKPVAVDLPGITATVSPSLTTAFTLAPSVADSAITAAALPSISGNRLSLSNINRLVKDLGSSGIRADLLETINADLLKISNLKPGLFDDNVVSITDGTVIADFYLPYLCSSDCPPVHFTITEPNMVVSLSLDKAEFCSDDNTSHPFRVAPAGGVVTGEGVLPGNNNFIFNPSAVALATGAKEKEIVFTYVMEDKSATLKSKVFRKPVANFEFSTGAASHRDIVFSNKSQFGTLFEWDFGESTDSSDTSNKENPGNHIYKDEGEYTVTLKVINGICSDTITKVIKIVTPGNINLSLAIKEFCSEDKTEFPFSVSPANAKITGEGVVQKPTGEFVFVPDKVNIGTQLNKTIAFTGTAAGNTDGSFNAVVHHRPAKPVFTSDRVGTTDEVLFNITQADFAQLFQWKFGDGQSLETSARKIVHPYLQQGGDFVVTLVAINGTCSSEPVSATIALPPIVVVNKTCIPAKALVTEFEKLKTADANLFELFTQQLAVFTDIKKFFTDFAPLASKPPEVQLEYFVDKKAGILLEKWVAETADKFGSDFRTLAIALFKVLTNMSMLVACVKKEDINAGDIKLSTDFKLIGTNLNKLKAILIPTLTPTPAPVIIPPAQKKILERFRDDLDEELTRVVANNEGKDAYKEIIGALIRIMKAMGF